MNILVFLPISRAENVQRMIDQVNELEVGDHNVSVLSVLDNLSIPVFETKYPTRCKYTGNMPVNNFNIQQRRKRIAEVFNMAKNHVNANIDCIFTVEDDTVIKKDSLLKLLRTYEEKEKVGLISGVQVGRWAVKMLGVWQRDGDIIRTLPFTPDQIIKVSACGFYCYITSRNNFVNYEYRWGDFGPDVNFGVDLEGRGFNNYCDMAVITGHDAGEILYPQNVDVKEFTLFFKK